MTRIRAALILCTILSGLSLDEVSAQASLFPSSVGVDFGLGADFPSALAPACPSGKPVVGGLRLGWTAGRFVRVQATASTIGNGARSSCGDALPCPADAPCLRREGIGQDPKPVGVRLLIEPTGGETWVNPRLFVGAGRLLGDGESYALLGAGVRVGDRYGPSLTLDVERFLFHAPVQVFESRTNEFLADSRDAVRLNLLRIGMEWGY